MPVHPAITALVGRTPLVALRRFGAELPVRLVAKLESANPGGSVKDRIALAMVEAAEQHGELAPGGTIVEPTSGNTGIGLAMVAASRGYRAVFTMPASMSVERRQLMAAFGAEIVLTPAADGMRGAMAEADRLAAEHGWTVLHQFDNPANPDVHRRTTAEEILADMADAIGGDPDPRHALGAFVAGIGTGGTITGVGQRLKAVDDSIVVIGVEPDESPVLSGGEPGPHRIQGIGAGFVPGVLDTSAYDEIVRVGADAAADAARRLARTEGILTGISSGAALAAATDVASHSALAGRTVLVMLPDTGERYLSTGLFPEPER